MISITSLWQSSPRWIRGWFIGSLGYVALSLCTLWIQLLLTPWEWLLFLTAPTILPPTNTGQLLSHFLWCAIGALCIYRWGERKGLLILLFALILVKLGYIIWVLYALSGLTIS